MNIKILLEKTANNKYTASVPALDGCSAQAETREQALDKISRAIDKYFETKFSEIEPTAKGEIIELAI